jgi:acyl-CoA-dependent ceramide synthase
MTHNMSSPFSLSYLNTLTTRLPPSLRPFFLLSYPVPPSASRRLLSPALGPGPTLYGKGPEDIYFTISCALGFTILREICVRYILRWFALLWLGPVDRVNGSGKGKGRTIKDERERRRLKRKRQHVVTRFAEQGWSFLYCSVFWSMGMVRGLGSKAWNGSSRLLLALGYALISFLRLQ